MATVSELKEKLAKVEKALIQPSATEQMKKILRATKEKLQAQIDEAESDQKKKVVKPKAEKKEKPGKVKIVGGQKTLVTGTMIANIMGGKAADYEETVKDYNDAIREVTKKYPGVNWYILLDKSGEFLSLFFDNQKEYEITQDGVYQEIDKAGKPVRNKPELRTSDLKGYALSIYQATGADVSQLEEIEDYMRHEIFHSTLDWQSKEEFNKAALMAYEELYGKKAPKVSKSEPKPENDDLAECKKLLQEANYDVKEKTVKGKDGKKRKIKTKEPRQDRTIIKDRTESVFTTMTKEYNSEKEKEENKALLELVDTVKEIMVKFMVSLDKLVASKEVDKIKKIKELLNKLVD